MYPYIHTNKALFKLQCREELLSFDFLFNMQEILPSKTHQLLHVLTLQKALIELYRTQKSKGTLLETLNYSPCHEMISLILEICP